MTDTPPAPTPTSPKVIASAIAAAVFIVLLAALSAITPELLEPLGPWSLVAFAAVQGLIQVVAGWAKRDPLRSTAVRPPSQPVAPQVVDGVYYE